MFKFLHIAAALFGLLTVSSVNAIEVPVNDGFVTDTVGLLSTEQDALLEDMLTVYRIQTSNEIAVVILKDLHGEAPVDAAVEIGRAWGVGSEKDNGIIMLISYETRDMFIATGYGLEGAVPDLVAHGITEIDMAPHFRDGEYYEGIAAGIVALQKHIGGEYTAERYSDTGEGGFSFTWLIFIVFIGIQYMAAWLGKSKSWWAGGIVGGVLGVILAVIFSWWLSIPALVALGLLFDYIVSTLSTGTKRGRSGRGGWGGPFGGGSSNGGGGFGGFGGGSFGGGGGGGKW